MHRLTNIRTWINEIRECLKEGAKADPQRRSSVLEELQRLAERHAEARAAIAEFANAHIGTASLDRFAAAVEALEAALPDTTDPSTDNPASDLPLYPDGSDSLLERIEAMERRFASGDGLPTRAEFREMLSYVRHLANATIGRRKPAS